jgi:hypothetical protein
MAVTPQIATFLLVCAIVQLSEPIEAHGASQRITRLSFVEPDGNALQ